MEWKLLNFDPTKILNYGVIGLGFLLAFLAYRLLTKEQQKQEPQRSMLTAIYVFMFFSFALCVIGLASEFTKNITPPIEKPTGKFDDYLASLRIQYAHGQKPDHFLRGHLTELQEVTLQLDLPAGACEDYLAASEQNTEIDTSWWSNGPGARKVVVTTNGGSNYKTGTICTDDKSELNNAEVGMVVKMLRGSGQYALETYFHSAILWKHRIPR
jgi:hypothetical protein